MYVCLATPMHYCVVEDVEEQPQGGVNGAAKATPSAAQDADLLPTVAEQRAEEWADGVYTHTITITAGGKVITSASPIAQRYPHLVARMEADAFTIWSQASQDMRTDFIENSSFAPNVHTEVVNLNVHEGITVAPDLLANLKKRVARYIFSISTQHESRLRKQSADAIVEKVRKASVLLCLQCCC
jgi:hypothetical protein